ncbi:tail fiber protein [Streptomyces lunaelactis]|uniref:phage tail protein n=1 Tax=Streptomyces lunaelactis TaxID=1535768 RepID=UPI0015859B79|nr:tail fiber protein [Streptomyces lunaelactis]NUJ99875.1 tail fiber protein [Streptomyces lunaelactis]NUK07112.1 tail fiber protein [Streptomyces lunaelactis]NUK15304.1 tail fiber protein [Streptomyces lunaelactis]NUK32841.1 tail fiber protein [Streptomyces lunaelactis]NUK39744.1 tail fiber protein [Streptomyces lunaelactis]
MTDQDSTKPVVPLGDLVVGAIVPYGGRIDAGTLYSQGWLYCDGRELDPAEYSELFAVIGTLHGGNGNTTFDLPDYRGYLLRGVDDYTGRDPDAGSRTAANQGGAAGDKAGSVQNHAAALPATTPFTLGSPGSHSHSVSGVPTDSSSTAVAGKYRSIWNKDSVDTDSAGEHHHSLSGGDTETRPVNAYVNFLIRCQA